jgi:hypothetical protein
MCQVWYHSNPFFLFQSALLSARPGYSQPENSLVFGGGGGCCSSHKSFRFFLGAIIFVNLLIQMCIYQENLPWQPEFELVMSRALLASGSSPFKELMEGILHWPVCGES